MSRNGCQTRTHDSSDSLTSAFCSLMTDGSERRIVIGLFGAALLVRLLLLPLPGFQQDVNWYVSVAALLHTEGVLGAYEPEIQARAEGGIVNYLPLALEVLWALSPVVEVAKNTGVEWLPGAIHRLPAILADLLIAGLLYLAFVRPRAVATGSNPPLWRMTPLQGRALLAVILFNPGPLYIGAGFGQTDAVAVLGIVASLVFLNFGRHGWSGVCAGLALGFKMQVLVLMPALAVAVLLRSHGQSSDSLVRRSGLWGAGFLGALVLPWIPYILSGKAGTAWNATLGTNLAWSLNLSSGAFNLWALTLNPLLPDILPLEMLFSSEGMLPASGIVAAFTHRRAGLLLFAAGYALVLAVSWRQRRQDLLGWWLVASAAYLFFTFTTRVHERYLLAFMPLAVPLVIGSSCWFRRAAFALLSASYVLNLLTIAPVSGEARLLSDIPGWARYLGGVMTLLGGAWLVLPPRGPARWAWKSWRYASAWVLVVAITGATLTGLTAQRADPWRKQTHLQDIPIEVVQPHWLLQHRMGLSVNDPNPGPLTVGGVIGARGIGMHAPSRLAFDVEGPVELRGSVGVDDETLVHARGSLVASVLVNGATQFTSGMLKSGGQPQAFAIPLPNSLNRLELVLDSRGPDLDDHADWLGMRLTGGPQ